MPYLESGPNRADRRPLTVVGCEVRNMRFRNIRLFEDFGVYGVGGCAFCYGDGFGVCFVVVDCEIWWEVKLVILYVNGYDWYHDEIDW